ncbi:hypothetical protein [Streptosporangium subroseum]|nr:hypothetical protein [Streptosporangium subroseum]
MADVPRLDELINVITSRHPDEDPLDGSPTPLSSASTSESSQTI